MIFQGGTPVCIADEREEKKVTTGQDEVQDGYTPAAPYGGKGLTHASLHLLMKLSKDNADGINTGRDYST